MSSNHIRREDYFSPTWKRTLAHLDERLRELRARNDGQLDPTETATIRGSIAEIKKLLALADEASAGMPVVPEELRGDDVMRSE